MARKAMISESRTYVAQCNSTNFDSQYFCKFTLPRQDAFLRQEIALNWDYARASNVEKENFNNMCLSAYVNDSDFASWYFLNRIDCSACIDGVITNESYSDLKEV